VAGGGSGSDQFAGWTSASPRLTLAYFKIWKSGLRGVDFKPGHVALWPWLRENDESDKNRSVILGGAIDATVY
jgi:hypothetical protein